MNKVLMPYTTFVSIYKSDNKNMKFLDNDGNLSILNTDRDFEVIPREELDDFFANRTNEYTYRRLSNVYVIVGVTDDKLDDALTKGSLIDIE